MSETKSFSLKPIELRLLQVEQELYQTKASNLLTFFATERLAYNVTEKTRFELEGDTLKITEVEDEAEPAPVSEPIVKGDSVSGAATSPAK